jgi:uncharacterized protein (DUF58 family)
VKLVVEILKSLQLTHRFYILYGAGVFLMALGFLYSPSIQVALVYMLLLLAATVADSLLLFNPSHSIECHRETSKIMSLGDQNPISLTLTNRFPLALQLDIRDELPEQLQERNFLMKIKLSPGQKEVLNYTIKPLNRGKYTFEKCNVLATSIIGLARRRHRLLTPATVPVFPSLLQMREFDLKAFAHVSNFQGIKKVRRLGHSYEFDQIKSYVRGDDVRSINWKATSRRSTIMVNQYEDERAQQVYCIIDKGRTMKMPFEGLSLLDYSINTSLVIGNIALKKNDKAGLVTFCDKLGTTIKADRSNGQLKKILHALYNEKEHKKEANYELLYSAIKNMIQQRSLLFLFLNFESEYSLDRVLPILRKIAKHHLLVVVVFKNTELEDFTTKEASNVRDIYVKTISRKLAHDKQNMVRKLRKRGIQTLYTEPQDLSMNTVNKYLELKSRGLI